MRFEDMGKHWTAVRDSARAGTLGQNDEGVDDVVERWDEFSRYLCLHLGRELGADVQQVLARRDRSDPAGHRTRLAKELADQGALECTLRVPGAVADINVRADLATRTVAASLAVDAPGDGRPRTRVNWLVRQLRNDAPGEVRVDTAFESRSVTTSNLLEALTANPDDALLDDRRIAPRRFTVTLTRSMGMQRGSGARSFIGSVTRLVDEFYRLVAQNLENWRPRAPRLPEHPASPSDESPDDEAPESQLVSRQSGTCGRVRAHEPERYGLAMTPDTDELSPSERNQPDGAPAHQAYYWTAQWQAEEQATLDELRTGTALTFTRSSDALRFLSEQDPPMETVKSG